MPTQSTAQLQEDVSLITVIQELVLGFLSLTIEVDSFDPEKGWWFSFTAGTSPAYPGLGFDRVLEDGQPSLALWLSLRAGYSRSRSWMGAEKTTHSPSINRWSGAWYLNIRVLDRAVLRNDSFPLNWHAFSEGFKNERALHIFQAQWIKSISKIFVPQPSWHFQMFSRYNFSVAFTGKHISSKSRQHFIFQNAQLHLHLEKNVFNRLVGYGYRYK